MPMASSKSTYAERLCLADSFEEYKEYFSKQHYEFLVHEALEETRRGVGKLKYVLALARRCKGGVVSVETLAEKVDKEYSLLPLPPQEQSGAEGAEGGGQQQIGMEGEGVAEFEDVDTEVDEPGQQDAKEQNNYEQEQAGVDEEEAVCMRSLIFQIRQLLVRPVECSTPNFASCVLFVALAVFYCSACCCY